MISLVARGIASLAGRMATRNPRLGKKIFDLLKKPKGITVYRGQNVVHRSSLADAQKAMGSHGAGVGRWFSDDPKLAMRFAGKGTFGWKPRHWKKMWEMGGPSGFGYRKGIVEKMRLTKMEADIARRLEGKLGGFGHHTPSHNFEYLIVPKYTLPRVEKAPILTAVANLRRMLGMYKHGGLARILEV